MRTIQRRSLVSSKTRHQTARSGTKVPVRVLATAIAFALGAATPAWADTFSAGNETELIQAINDANANAGPDTIAITADILLSASLPVISEMLTLHGIGGTHHSLTRDDSGANACSPTAINAFRLIDASADLTLQDLTLSGGCNLVDQGGAVRVQGAALLVERSTISGNQTFVENADYTYGAGGMGGGAAVLYGSATLVDSTISGNHSHGALCGGGGVVSFYGDIEVVHSTVSGNSANGDGAFGGGLYGIGDVYNSLPGTFTITDSLITDNEIVSENSPQGGGLASFEEKTTITDSTITDNRLIGGDTAARGGGLIIGSWSPTDHRIERTLISGNSITSLSGFGGGMHVGAASDQVGAAAAGVTVTVVDSTVADNTVDGGSKASAGGMFIESVLATLVNTTVSGNKIIGLVDERGGALMLLSEGVVPVELKLYNSTIASNESLNSDSAGLLFMREPIDAEEPAALFESSIIAGNMGQNGLADVGVATGAAPAIVANHSLIQGTVDVGSGSFVPDATTIALRGEDPQLQPLANNGGLTPTHALAATSPAIDQGSNTRDLDFDQRGSPYARVVGVAADIGAYELDLDRIFANGFD